MAQQQAPDLGRRCAARSSSSTSGPSGAGPAATTCPGSGICTTAASQRSDGHRRPSAGKPPAKPSRKVIDEFHLDYPTCVDIPPEKGVKAWGDLFGRFAVLAIPHAVAVDGKGTIIACGRLQDVYTKARELTRKAR